MIKGATICRNVLQRCIAPMQRIAAKNATRHFWAGLKPAPTLFLIQTIILTNCTDYERNIEAEQNAMAGSSSDAPQSSSSVAVMLSSSGNAVQAWCVYAEQHLCFQVSLSECPGNGVMLPECPLSSSGSVPVGNSSSSDIVGASSSSAEEPPAYAYCVFALSQICLPGPFASDVCVAMDGEPGNTCPYASSSSSSIGGVSPSSGSGEETSSSSVGADNHQPSSSSEETPSSSSQQQESSSGMASSSSANDSSSSIASSSSQQQSSSGTGSSEGSFVYEGQTYKTVKIGTQTWMAENLNYNVSGSKCYGEESFFTSTEIQANCDKYGRLYNWATAMGLDASYNSTSYSTTDPVKHRGICPSGWHIPSGDDWNILISYIHTDNDLANHISGLSTYAGGYLKATNGWNSNGNGTDKYGFAALPGGYYNTIGYFDAAGDSGYWWISSEPNTGGAYSYHMGYITERAYWDTGAKAGLRSVRCMRDD